MSFLKDFKGNFVDRWISPYRGKNDNRNYKYSINSFGEREEFKLIVDWVKKRSSVIDLGCGDGTLMQMLEKKGAKTKGMEISRSGVKVCRNKGLTVVLGRIDKKLPYKDNQFDYAVCNVTLQMVMYPEILISEMKRIAKRQIFTFPNFAFLPNRLDLLINGKMPRIMIPGYNWYSTGHIHQLSLADFENYCKKIGLKIAGNKHIYPGETFPLGKYIISSKFMKKHSNLFASMAVFLTKK